MELRQMNHQLLDPMCPPLLDTQVRIRLSQMSLKIVLYHLGSLNK